MGKRPKQVGNLTFGQKKRICEWRDEDITITQKQLAEKAQRELCLLKAPTQGTISNILKAREQYVNANKTDLDCKRARVLAFPAVDEALANWVLQCQSKRISLSGGMIQSKAKRLAVLSGIPPEEVLEFSDGWLHSFQKRHGFKNFRIHGESGSVNSENIPAQREAIRKRLMGVPLADTYNMDESGLFYCMAPDKTIARRQIEGSKKAKTRMTIAFACNADGSDKREPFIIGHAAKPRCFKKKTGEQLGFYYRNNKKAWMTGVLFQDWVRELDNDMTRQRRHIILLVDNASAHIEENLELKSVTIIFLPPNTTSRLQPLDAGIIASFKRRYRRRQLDHALDVEEEGVQTDIYKIDQLTAMRWVKACWRELTPECILNSFRHTGLIPGRTTSRRALREEDELVQVLEQRILALRVRDPMDIDEFVCHAAEQETEMEAVSAEDLLSDAVNDLLLASVQQDSEVVADCNDNEEGNQEESECLPTPMSPTEKVEAVRSVIFLLAEHPDLEMTALTSLRALQGRVRDELQAERDAALRQTSIRSFFSKAD